RAVLPVRCWRLAPTIRPLMTSGTPSPTPSGSRDGSYRFRAIYAWEGAISYRAMRAAGSRRAIRPERWTSPGNMGDRSVGYKYVSQSCRTAGPACGWNTSPMCRMTSGINMVRALSASAGIWPCSGWAAISAQAPQLIRNRPLNGPRPKTVRSSSAAAAKNGAAPQSQRELRKRRRARRPGEPRLSTPAKAEAHRPAMHAFDVLGDPVRRRILELLAHGERSAGSITDEIQKEFGITQAGVSQHLRAL